ncbi:MAG: hypothetical protein JJT88_10160 [Gammaproteobacteria bacterium]|nr:hypothetical protein [Gammaproteobacteria bacterium]
MKSDSTQDPEDLGFRFRTRKSGDVEILHFGRVATTLRGKPAVAFLAEVTDSDERTLQQRMARLTGNYKRGNERRGSGRQR